MTMNTGPTFCDNTGDGSSPDLTAAQLNVGGMQPADASMDQSSTKQSGTNIKSGTSIEKAKRDAADAAQELKGVASQAGAGVSDATRRTAAQAKDAAGRVVEQAKGQAKQLTQQLTQQASEQGTHFFNEQKTRAADSLGGISAALRCAATTLQEEQDKNLATYADSLAGGVESCATYVRDADPRRLMSDAGAFARRRPEWVLGGAFIAGLALVRFLKASRSDTNGSQYDEMGGSSHRDYATSDEFMDSDDLVSRYRAGAHPGIDATRTDAGTSLNPDAISSNDQNTRTNPATGLTL